MSILQNRPSSALEFFRPVVVSEADARILSGRFAVTTREPDSADLAAPPRAEDEAWLAGHTAVMEGAGDPAPPDGWDYPRMVAFFRGMLIAREEMERAEDEMIDRLAMAALDPDDWRHEAEIAEVIGSVELRKGCA